MHKSPVRSSSPFLPRRLPAAGLRLHPEPHRPCREQCLKARVAERRIGWRKAKPDRPQVSPDVEAKSSDSPRIVNQLIRRKDRLSQANITFTACLRRENSANRFVPVTEEFLKSSSDSMRPPLLARRLQD